MGTLNKPPYPLLHRAHLTKSVHTRSWGRACCQEHPQLRRRRLGRLHKRRSLSCTDREGLGGAKGAPSHFPPQEEGAVLPYMGPVYKSQQRPCRVEAFLPLQIPKLKQIWRVQTSPEAHLTCPRQDPHRQGERERGAGGEDRTEIIRLRSLTLSKAVSRSHRCTQGCLRVRDILLVRTRGLKSTRAHARQRGLTSPSSSKCCF